MGKKISRRMAFNFFDMFIPQKSLTQLLVCFDELMRSKLQTFLMHIIFSVAEHLLILWIKVPLINFRK